MKISTIFAIIVCTVLPISCYFIVKNYTATHVKMPKKYFYDSVIEDTVDGKKHTDTVWHKVKNLRMVNQYGDTVSMDSLRGKVVLVNFFFTHCPSVCPAIMANLQKVQATIVKDSDIHIVSITMDPKRDTVKALRAYANKYDIKHDNWWLCRLVDDTVATVIQNEFKGNYKLDSTIDFIHTEYVYLLDKKRIIRGKDVPSEVTPENPDGTRFYNGRLEKDMAQIGYAAGLIKVEKTVKGKPPFVLLIISMVLCGLVFFWMYRKRKKEDS